MEKGALGTKGPKDYSFENGDGGKDLPIPLLQLSHVEEELDRARVDTVRVDEVSGDV